MGLPSPAPRRLGRYEILRPLARGGMAEIFLARAIGIEGFEKLVVVKRIRPELAADAEFVQMFLDEARLAATLHHSNIVQVYDIGADEGAHFFSMEYLHGEDVRSILGAAARRAQLVPLEHALSIAIGVSAGLHYAHEKTDGDGRPLGIVHRDVTPHNVAVTYDGGVKLVDFGIAKARRRLAETRHGTLKGKIHYMSPEQCSGDAVDRRSDVFAIAILLWELTCGRRLFGGRSDLAIMKAITERDAPRPSRARRDYPAELEAIVVKGLARRPDDRFQTAEELQLALEAFARERRLALSTVGLARYVRELFAGRAEAWSAALSGGREAIESLVASRIAERPEDDEPTLRDQAVEGEEPEAVTASIDPDPGSFDPDPGSIDPGAGTPEPKRRTRAARRPLRRARALALAGGAAMIALVAAGVIARRSFAPTSTSRGPAVVAAPADSSRAAVVAAPADSSRAAVVAAPADSSRAAVVAAPADSSRPVVVAAPADSSRAAVVAAPADSVTRVEPTAENSNGARAPTVDPANARGGEAPKQRGAIVAHAEHKGARVERGKIRHRGASPTPHVAAERAPAAVAPSRAADLDAPLPPR